MKASFTEHLAALRRRLIIVVLLFALASALSYPLSAPLLIRMKADLLPGVTLVILDPLEAVTAYVTVSMALGFALTLPVIIYHFWSFLSPGLMRDERRLLLYLVLPSSVLFCLGACFGYFVLLPVALGFLVGEAAPLATPMISLGSFISFVSFSVISLGIIFQMPLISAALAKMGVLTHRHLSAYRRHAIVVLFLAAGILTPDPSPVTQALLAVPMLALYESSIATARLVGGG